LIALGLGAPASPGLAVDADAARPTAFAFIHANVVPMDADRVLRDQTVVVSDGRITAIGPAATTSVPKGARVVDAAGKFLSPGLADMHVHVYTPQELTLYVVNGVTSVLNLNGRPQYLAWRGRIASGDLLGPFVYSAGPTFSRKQTAEAAVAEVDRQAAAGWDAIKIYNQVGAAEYPAIAAEAKKKGMAFVGHVPREPGFAATLAAGQSIAHAEEYVYTYFNDDPDPAHETIHPLDTAKIPKAVAMTREAGIAVIPTLVAFRNIVRQATNVKAYLKDPHFAYLAPFMRAQLEPERNTYANRWTSEKLSGLAVSYEFQRQLVKALHDGGVPILAGTDASWLGVPGFCLHDELEIFQELGFTPFAALKTATAEPARFLKREGEFGTVAVGRRADLVLTRENPLEDVENLRRPLGVMAAGRWIPHEEGRRLLDGVPASYRDTLARLTREAETDPKALDAYLSANDPWGEIGAAVLGSIAAARGPQAIADTLARVRRSDPDSPLVREEAVNELGYALVAKKDRAAAIEVFRLNTTFYPKSANTYDSLAETYLGAGDTKQARELYAKALEVDPDYPNAKGAREALAKLAP
jgi:tetratricopeptide (TPR) repeat protein